MRRRGLSVVEAVLGFTLAALGIAAAMALLSTSFLLSAQSQHGIHGEQILQQLVECYAVDCERWVGGVYRLDPVYGVDQVPYLRSFRVEVVRPAADGAPALHRLRVETGWSWKGRTYQRERTRLQCLPAR